MPVDPTPGQVALAGGRSASRILHDLLRDACAAFPDALAAADVPVDAATFRRTYPHVLAAFEAARAASDVRAEIARFLAAGSQQQLAWQDEQGECPLPEALARPAEPLELTRKKLTGIPGWRPTIVYRGERWEADNLEALGETLVARHVASTAAGDALCWLEEHLGAEDAIDLTGRKVVVMGAGAEMAPTRYWLEAGADLLWLDVVPPPSDWFGANRFAGRVSWPAGNVDLLARPQEVLATILAFADGDPVDLGLYAYAPGQAREYRLAATMNAIVNALPQEQVTTVTMLVSPTTPAALDGGDQAAMAARRKQRPLWEAALARAGLLGRRGGVVECGDAAATRTVVDIQGTSYQAAQYLEKVLMAECWATSGVPAGGGQPLRVSANVAAITRTRSLDHPVFAAAFGGAAAFGVETFPPRLSRRLNGLLALHDWLAPELPVPMRVRVHGGIHTLPYPLEPALRIAAAIGFARAPRLLKGLLRG